MHRHAPLPVLLVVLACASCYPHLMPKDPVVSVPADYLGPAVASSADYSGRDRQVDQPVLPFRLWGLDFEEEVLFEFGNHPTYGMVEITRVRTRDGEEAWFVLVSERNGLQHVVVGTAAARRMAETFPAPVHEGRLRVIRLASDKAVEYTTAFELPNGQLVQATITSKLQGSVPPKRNGNAMNHSADRVLAVLDLEEFNWAQASVLVDGESVPVRWLAPFLPFAWRLEQAAGGMSWGAVEGQAGTAEGVALELFLDDVDEAIPFRWERQGELFALRGSDRVVDLVYRFRPLGEGPEEPMELVGARVEHAGVNVFDVEFNPALPDLRWLPDKTYQSLMVAGSNGLPGYMVGRVELRAEEGRAVVDLLPAHPFWACERPVRNRIQYRGDRTRLRAEITPSLAADGAGAEACFDLDR